VVGEATPKNAPLHPHFEWDDTKAAQEHRLEQARHMIRNTPVIADTGETQRLINVPVVKVEGPTAVIEEREGVYKPVSMVVRDPGDYQKALNLLMTQRNAMERTIRDLRRAAKDEGKEPKYINQLVEALAIAKSTLSLMADSAQAS
jgi:hypothetical protein